jgi:predicted small lipoprotein YifL
MKHPILTVFAAVLLLSACGRDGPFTPTEEWAADLGETKQVLFMIFTVRNGTVSGNGTLAYLVDRPEALTLNGRRTPDSLYVTFARASIPAFTFTGRYAGCCIQGILHGSEFDSVGVGFERP